MSLSTVKLNDKYELDAGRIYLSGTQAFIRILLMQRDLDRLAGLNTAGFISGYRGSPMTAIDEQLWRAEDYLNKQHVHFWPGVNEHMAATAVWGTQQVGYFNDANYDGVYSMWYGKGPGVDQSMDAIRQGNYHGSAKHGGVLILSGDDPAMRSTIEAYHSELLFEDLLMPVLYPADIQEVYDLGLVGIALSRFSGNWVGYKCLPETIETAASINGSASRCNIVLPDFEFPPDGVNSRAGDWWSLQEERIWNYRVPAAIAFARANRLNRVTWHSSHPRIGIIAMGKTWRDTLQALNDLGITEKTAIELGISVLKVSMPWPVDEQSYLEFAEGLEEVIVIEDKREQIENAIRKVCYALPENHRPRIAGRKTPDGQPLVSNVGDLTADDISMVIASRIGHVHNSQIMRERIAFLDAQHDRTASLPTVEMARLPYFCSGCPHNSSTRVPKDSRSFGGVGCHFMAAWMDREVYGWTQMGGEGVTWIGQAPFVKTRHMFQQLGDGTYYHSGTVAIRAAVAAGINITYKILYNDAVAMTGGQPVDGPLSVSQITHQVYQEGIRRIAVISDEPEKYANYDKFAPDTSIHHRRELEEVQRELREIEGVTVLIYDQTCAAEKRRRRKRGTFPDPAKRAFINDRICEGCGDCSNKSNCLSVLPVDTDYGRKREIDQSSCNKDYSCIEGFCPSFVTVLGGQPRKGQGIGEVPASLELLPEPELPDLPENNTYGILLAGTGGTGVVTVGAILGMAAHVDNNAVSIVDQLGFAQKGGPVQTHIRLGKNQDCVNAVRINAGSTDLLLGFDMLVAGQDDVLQTIQQGRSSAIVNTQKNFTGEFTRNPDLQFPSGTLETRINKSLGLGKTEFLNASRTATRLMGNSIAGNLFLVGFAWQKGLIPLSSQSILKAVELNGVAVSWNQEAFEWGRRTAAFPEKVDAVAFGEKHVLKAPESTQSLIERRAAELEKYQDRKWADRYRDLLARVKDAEIASTSGKTALVTTVANNAFKLMAYKDEYEVGRLHSDPEFKRKLNETFEGDFKLEFNLAPPLLARKDKKTGIPRKMQFGPWMMSVFGILSKFKFLRGTKLDPFGWTSERRMERRLIEEYFGLIDQVLESLDPANHTLAVELASLPEKIRGYGYIKEESVESVKLAEKALVEKFHSSRQLAGAA